MYPLNFLTTRAEFKWTAVMQVVVHPLTPLTPPNLEDSSVAFILFNMSQLLHKSLWNVELNLYDIVEI